LIKDMTTWDAPPLPPLPDQVAGVRQPVIDLAGPWHWTSGPEDSDWLDTTSREWQPVDIPNDLDALGLEPASGHMAFRRSVDIPADFKGQQVFLRFEGAMFEAAVWIDGREAGRHRGGFTTWTRDITGLVTAGTPAELLVGLKSLPGQLNAAQTGGLIRPVRLLALPPVHIGRLHCRTCRSANDVDFDLHIQLELAGAAQGLKVRFDLTGPDNQTAWSASYAADQLPDTIAPTIPAPLTWDGEHPRLYTLTCALCRGDQVLEQVSQAVGFREIRWGDGQLQVNGRPVKLRGVCYQACAPTTGKAISPDLLAEDLRLLKAAHVNFIRTAGSPPLRELLDLCDRLGVYVQVDAPFDEIDQSLPATQNSPRWTGDFLSQVAEMVERDQDHPSLLIWCLGNESAWGSNLRLAAEHIRRTDGTRPLIFSYPMSHDGEQNPPDLWSVHYLDARMDPGVPFDHLVIGHTHGSDDPPGYALGFSRQAGLPVLHDAIARVACHDRDALRRDPAVREFWGQSMLAHWDRIWASPNALGCAVWSAVDDVTIQSGGSRLNAWGLLDVWRRPKPEYWHVRRAYAPLRLRRDSLKQADGAWQIEIENRFCHTDLDELAIRWQSGSRSGRLAGCTAGPGQTGILNLPAEAFGAGQTCQLSFYDAAGLLVEALTVSTQTPGPALPQRTGRGQMPAVEEVGDRLLIRLEQGFVRLSKITGQIEAAEWAGQVILTGGPGLIMTGIRLPDWTLDRMEHVFEDNRLVVTIQGHYGSVVSVTFRLQIDAGGRIDTNYTLDAINLPMPRTVKIRVGLDTGGLEEIGVSYQLDASVDRLSWQRQGLWTHYPEDHLGRPQGTAVRTGAARQIRLGERPAWPWALDEKQFDLYGRFDTGWRGSLDFRSAKHNICQATAWSSRQAGAVTVLSDGRDAVRLDVVPHPDSVLDDRDARIRYSGTWYAMTDRSGSWRDTEMASQTAGDRAEVSFTGTGIEWYGPQDMIGGIARVLVDGQPAEPAMSQGPLDVERPGMSRGYEKRYQRLLFAVSGLPDGPHTLTIEVTGQKDKGADYPYVLIDWFRVHQAKPDPVRLAILNQWNVRRLAWGNQVREAIRVAPGDGGHAVLQLGAMPAGNEKAGARP